MLVVKKMFARKAAEEVQSDKPTLKSLIDKIEGGAVFLFSDTDPFKIALLLNRITVKVSAKGGDAADSDVVVPTGNTGIPPGPVISEFGAVKIPTKIDSGTIWVSKDTVVAKKGEVISLNLASLLSRLGIKPVESRLSLISAASNELIFSGEELKIDLDDYSNQINKAAVTALHVAVNVGIPTQESLPLIITKAWREAKQLALEAEYPDTQTIKDSIIQAQQRASLLSSKVTT
jgi:large subunit ribosomal protein L10